MSNHTTRRGLILFLALLSLAGLACRLNEIGSVRPVPTQPLPVMPVYITNTPQADASGTATVPATAVAEEELPATVPVAPSMTAKVSLYVRRGPGTNYDILTALRPGETAAIVGRSPDGFWWKIVCPSGFGGECWSSAREPYSSARNVLTVPVAAVPPSPTPTATATQTATATFTATPTATSTATATATATPTRTPTPKPPAYP